MQQIILRCCCSTQNGFESLWWRMAETPCDDLYTSKRWSQDEGDCFPLTVVQKACDDSLERVKSLTKSLRFLWLSGLGSERSGAGLYDSWLLPHAVSLDCSSSNNHWFISAGGIGIGVWTSWGWGFTADGTSANTMRARFFLVKPENILWNLTSFFPVW